ncbi:uncharacterized protein LOC130010378 [Patella vulgata]|uniref:uncharacterized protein LOC130010378 n=1 Tax=Patella vulgata TaxID=6465 RepID=UPI0021807F0D|nr:uncharacterized protein LOC130010378 [Patella vulgata]
MMMMSVCRCIDLFRLRTPLKLMSRWSSYNVMNPGGQGTSYGDVQRGNQTFCGNAKDEILKIVENLISKPHLENEPFTVAEYGAADGSISMEFMTDIIRNIPNARSYLLDHENVYVTSARTSFYEQCFPSNSVDLALSFTATQWLSKPVYPNYTLDAASKLAADDWTLFLKNRTKELKPGGLGVFSTLGGRDATPGEPVCIAFQDGLNEVGKIWNDLFDRGVITKSDLDKGTIAICFRSPCELKQPINDSKELMNMGLKVKVKSDAIPCFYVTEWKQKLEQGSNDWDSFARGMTKYLKIPAYNTFCGALGSERSEEQKSQIFESVFEGMEKWFLSKYPGDMNPYCFYTSTYVQKE